MKREIKDYLNDIVDAMDKSITFTSEMNYEDFVKDTRTVYAVIRALEIIGEAVEKILEIQEKISSNSMAKNGWDER